MNPPNAATRIGSDPRFDDASAEVAPRAGGVPRFPGIPDGW
jgi:hypothetical protein